MRPKVTSLYLLTMAAMISVPPVLPLAQNATPIPPPSHEVLSFTQYLGRNTVCSVHHQLQKPQKESEHENGIRGLDAEFRAKYFDGKCHQYGIDDEI